MSTQNIPRNTRHSGKRRIIALDLLRGLFLIIIFINHLAWSPSVYTFITGDSHLLASAAEGFFAISGILVGYIYGPKILKTTRSTTIKILKRAGWLYLLSIFFTILYSLIVLPLSAGYMRTYFVFSDIFANIFDYILKVLTLQFIFGWADFLARYAVFMLFAPIALWLIAKKQSWVVLSISVLVWITFSFILAPGNLFTGWVVIFFPSIVIGFYLDPLEKWFKNAYKQQPTIKVLVYTLITLSVVTYLFSSFATTMFPYLIDSPLIAKGSSLQLIMNSIVEVNTHLQQNIFNRETMGIGRILIGIFWFLSLYIIFRKYETNINSATSQTLHNFGTNSLYVYGWSSFLIIATDIVLPPVGWRSLALNTVVVSFMLAVLYIIVKKRPTWNSLQINFKRKMK